MDAKVIVDLAAGKGIAIKSHMSNISDAEERTLRSAIADHQAAAAAAVVLPPPPPTPVPAAVTPTTPAAQAPTVAVPAVEPVSAMAPRRPSGRVQLKEGETAAHTLTAPPPRPSGPTRGPGPPSTAGTPAAPAAPGRTDPRRTGPGTGPPGTGSGAAVRRPAASGPSAPTRQPPSTADPRRRGGGAPAAPPGKSGGTRPTKPGAGDEVDLSFLRGTVNASTVKDDPDIARRIRPVSKRRPRRDEGEAAQEAEKKKGLILEVASPVTVRELSNALGVKVGQLLAKLLSRGTTSTINDVISDAVAEELAMEFDREIKLIQPEQAEQMLESAEKPDAPELLKPRAPVVVVLGHVDHGKTSLLDKIRATKVAAGESGGITQHIGASRVERNGRALVFIDTPGHAAFTELRARGARVTDVAVLVVAADDGVMPQTEEAIAHIKAAEVPVVVALNKIDKTPNRAATLDRVKGQLAALGITAEDYGGDVLVVPCSALTGEGVDALLEAIHLQAEIHELKANPDRPARGTVLEAAISEGRGIVASVLVENGTLRRGDIVVAGSAWGRVRLMLDDRDNRIEEAGPSTPVQLMGLDSAPEAGDALNAVETEDAAQRIAEERAARQRKAALQPRATATLEAFMDRLAAGAAKELRLVLKCDVKGSVEAIKKQLTDSSTAEVRLELLHQGIGPVTESDIWLAESRGAIVLAYRVVADGSAKALASERGVEIRRYDIIYELLDDMKKAMEGMLEPERKEVVQSRVEVRKTFRFSRIGVIAGCFIATGLLERAHRLRVIRDGTVIIPDAKLESLRRFENDVREVKAGFECGLKVAGHDDIKPGDIIESFSVEMVKRALGGTGTGKGRAPAGGTPSSAAGPAGAKPGPAPGAAPARTGPPASPVAPALPTPIAPPAPRPASARAAKRRGRGRGR